MTTAITKKSSVSDIMEKPVTIRTEAGEVTITVNQVKKFLARGNKDITVNEAVEFIQMCKFNGLNPWVGDAFLVKFGDECQMVISKYAWMKRADKAGDRYEGFKAGVILLPRNWENKFKETGELPKPIYQEGSITFSQDLVGGWAEVYVRGKKFPVRAEVDFNEYVGRKKSGEISRMWDMKPATMIRKCALVAAQREAFPDLFGGLYTQEEIPEASDVEATSLEGEVLDIDKDTGEVIQDQEQEAGKEEPKKRLRRNVIQFNGENIKTCGIDGVHLNAIKNAEEKGYVKVVDEYLKSVGVADPTFLRKEEGKELVEILSRAMAEAPQEQKQPELEQEEEKAQADASPPWEERSQEPEEPESVPCPDRGGIEVEFAWCQDHCPKYSDSTCKHFNE